MPNSDYDPAELLISALETFLANTTDLVFIKDNNNRYVAGSQAFADIVGYRDSRSFTGKTDFDVVVNDAPLAARLAEDGERLLRSSVSVNDTMESILFWDGSRHNYAISKYVIRDASGAPIGLLGIGRDITELEDEKERRELSNQMFDAILEADITDNKVLRAESALWPDSIEMLKSFAYSKAIDFLTSSFVHSDYAREFSEHFSIKRLIADYERGLTEFTLLSYQALDSDGYKWIKIKTRLHRSKRDNALLLTSFLMNVDDEIRNREELQAMAETDSLTGLLNRKSVLDQIDECITGYGAGGIHALLFIDLDYFKQVNDTLGHLSGDRILREIADKLKGLFRESDIVGRVGGDEFLVFLKNVSSASEAEKKAKSVFDELPFCHVENGQKICINCSVGVSMYRGGGKTLEQLYGEADKAMYQAKERGRNRLEFYGE